MWPLGIFKLHLWLMLSDYWTAQVQKEPLAPAPSELLPKNPSSAILLVPWGEPETREVHCSEGETGRPAQGSCLGGTRQKHAKSFSATTELLPWGRLGGLDPGDANLPHSSAFCLGLSSSLSSSPRPILGDR